TNAEGPPSRTTSLLLGLGVVVAVRCVVAVVVVVTLDLAVSDQPEPQEHCEPERVLAVALPHSQLHLGLRMCLLHRLGELRVIPIVVASKHHGLAVVHAEVGPEYAEDVAEVARLRASDLRLLSELRREAAVASDEDVLATLN